MPTVKAAKGKRGWPKGVAHPHGATNIKLARNDENARHICQRIVEGWSLTQIAQEFGVGGHSTILMWVAQDEKFASQYYLAKRAQADHFAEEAIDIADDGSNDWAIRHNGRGEEYKVVDNEAVNRSKLRVETRFRLMAAYAPRRFGAKAEITHEVGDSFADALAAARQRRIAAIEAPLIDGQALDVVNAALHIGANGDESS